MKNILIVGTDYDILTCTAKSLDGENTTSYLAQNVEDAIEQISTNMFDIIVSDFSLENKSVLDLLSFLKRNKQFQFPPVIIYSSKSKMTIQNLTESVRYPKLRIVSKLEVEDLKNSTSLLLS